MMAHIRIAAARVLLAGSLLLATHAVAGAPRTVLPDTVEPERYRIDIAPDATALTFSGSVEIDIRVRESVDRIVLNAADLTIDRAAIAGMLESVPVRYDERLQRITLSLGRSIGPGPYTLRLNYHGRIYRRASGLFALDYQAVGSGSARALFTQFENADARRFVPCWDEPARKATFELAATIPAGQMAVSNMPIVGSEALPDRRQRVRFAPTPRMSSYLLFFAAGDFERRSRTVDGVEVGAVVKRGDLAQADFALDAAAEVLHYFNEYFGIPYALPKLDLIAGPGSSGSFGAMENWGAIFLFEADMLVDPRIASERDRQQVYVATAHEMAHQWFGDLVTMRWWDDLWLNEGFASWMENKVTDHFHPDWHMWLQSLDDRQRAMDLDARRGTHPIVTPVIDAQEADADFDEIAYEKGAAVVRTLESYLGEDAFRDGVRRYMRERAYGSAVTDDLWRAMDRGSQRPIAQIAHDLTRQAGVPMIIERAAECRGGETVLQLSQGRFVVDAGPTAAQIWHLPVSVATLGNVPATGVVAGAAAVPLHAAGCTPAILNFGQTAYFRSRYQPAGLAALTDRFGELSTSDQLGLLHDTQSLAYVGQVPMGALLSLVSAVPADAAPEVVTTLSRLLQHLDQLSDGLPVQVRLRAFSRSVLHRFFSRLGWDSAADEASNVALARAGVIEALAQMQDPDIAADARQRFAQYVSDPDRLDANLRHLTLDAVAAHADPVTWRQMHELARSARSELERHELYSLLATVDDPALVRKALALTLSGEPPATSVQNIVQTAARRHPRQAFEFATANWPQLKESIEPDFRVRFAPMLLHTATDPTLIRPLEAFAHANIPASARRDVDKAESSLRYRSHVRRERLPEVERWLLALGADPS